MKISNSYKIQKWLKENDIYFHNDVNISSRSWIKAGGIVRTFIQPDNIIKCHELIKFFSKEKINFYVLGNQSNVIVRDGVIETPIINFIKLSHIQLNKSLNGLHITCGSGVPIPKFSKYLTNQGYSGAEGILGIPGSIGGGICMNASSYNSYLATYIKDVKVVSNNGELLTLKKKDLNLRWRGSIIKDKRYVVLECKFFIPNKNYIGENETKKISDKILKHRRYYQENKLPNLGSIFATKNIYKDLSRKNIIFFLLYVFYKLGNYFFYKFNKSKILSFRKFMITLYLKMLGLDNFDQWSTSDKTLNCLVNKGAQETDKAISFLKEFKKKTKKYFEMENIILEDIQ